MTAAPPITDIIAPDQRLVMLVGGYGSGKTEVTVNLAMALATAGRRVEVADLDLVNPYFRSREARRAMEVIGVRVVVPPGAQAHADLPILLPEIQGMLHPRDGTTVLFDVGGDDVGARVLSSLRPALGDGAYELWQVVNGNRPFTGTAAGCHRMRAMVESASRMTVTGLVGNTHLVDETTPEAVLGGWRLVREVAAESGLPVRCVAVLDALADDPALAEIHAPVLRLVRRMLPPWLAPQGAAAEPDGLPAPRPVPIGKPPPMPPGRSAGDAHGSD